MPYFTVIIPTFNRMPFLKIAVGSVLTQSFRDFELIVIDDGSTDNTREVLDKYLKGVGFKVEGVDKDKRDTRYAIRNTIIKYFYQKNKGPAAARNSGIKKAKGEFICFLDSDDRFLKDKLTITRKYIDNFPDYKIFHTEELWYRNGAYLSQKKEHKKPSGFVFKQALKICSISMSTACINKDVFDGTGYFDESFPVCEDYEFWLRTALTFKIKLIPEYLTIKEGGRIDQQSKKTGLDKYRFLSIHKLINSGRIPKEMKKDTLENIREKALIYIQGARKRGKDKEAEEIKKALRKDEEMLCD